MLSPRMRESSSRMSRPTPKTRANSSRTGTTPTSTVPPLTPRRMNDIKTPSHIIEEAKTPSPNYFGLQIDRSGDVFASSAAQHIRGNWSPPSSNVRSTAAASPRVIPVDQNPEFEQFRRQSENNNGFALGKFDFGAPSSTAGVPQDSFFPPTKAPLSPQSIVSPSHKVNPLVEIRDDGSETIAKPRSPKRMLSTESYVFADRPRRNSPASFLDQEGFGRTDKIAEFVEDRNVRPSLPPKKSGKVPSYTSHHRAETLPAGFGSDGEEKMEGPTMTTAQHVVNILESAAEEVLLLDLRVSTQYAKARIAGALSLCIPTTLLKRASFNVQKLADTFKDDQEKDKFARWRRSKYIIVYDATSSQMKDATTCINTLKKFTTEGWTGRSLIIRGGFSEFSNKFPSWTTHGSSQHSPVAPSGSLHVNDANLPAVAPVIGGCPLPATQNAANPFFGNIRQNMDLIGGVGQLSISHPSSMTQSAEEQLPTWLKGAADKDDRGKRVSDKFLHIEKREQKRMQEALSGNVVYGTPNTRPDASRNIQIAGIEKGSKNRYNSIWPYEHTRVKLQGVEQGGCDYVNANHIETAWSNKRYIATQAPVQATFNVSLSLHLPKNQC